MFPALVLFLLMVPIPGVCERFLQAPVLNRCRVRCSKASVGGPGGSFGFHLWRSIIMAVQAPDLELASPPSELWPRASTSPPGRQASRQAGVLSVHANTTARLTVTSGLCSPQGSRIHSRTSLAMLSDAGLRHLPGPVPLAQLPERMLH